MAGSRFNLIKLVPMLEDVHDRIAPVTIARLPWEVFVRRYDRPGTLFYIDPPYWGCEDDYGQDVFSAADFERLSALLETIERRFTLSTNDVPEIRAIFDRFTIEPVDLKSRISGKVTAARELIISGP